MTELSILDADAVVAFHTKVEAAGDIRPNDAAGGPTVRVLTEMGIMATWVVGGDSTSYAKTESGLLVRVHSTAWTAELGATLPGPYLELPVGARGGVTALRARTSQRLPTGIDSIVPIVNGPEAIKLDSKLEQRRLFAGYMAAGVSIEPGADIDPAELNALPDEVWVKASNGLSSKGSRLTTRAKAQATLSELRNERRAGLKDPGWVVEAHDPGLPLPGLRAAVPELQRFIDGAPKDANHEMRLFTFIDSVDGKPHVRIVPMFRYCAGSADNTWIPVDSSSVEAGALGLAEEAALTVLKTTGYKGAHVAVDVYWSKDGRYKMREWNVRDPGVGSWLARGAALLTVNEQHAVGEVANHEHGNGFGNLLARLALAPYNRRIELPSGAQSI